MDCLDALLTDALNEISRLQGFIADESAFKTQMIERIRQQAKVIDKLQKELLSVQTELNTKIAKEQENAQQVDIEQIKTEALNQTGIIE